MKQLSALVRPVAIKPRKTLAQKDLSLHPVTFKAGTVYIRMYFVPGHRILIGCSARLGHELCSGSNRKHQTPSSSAPSTTQRPHPAFHFAEQFRRPHSPFPPTPDWIRAKLLNWGCLSPCQTWLTSLGVKAAVTGCSRGSSVKLISWKGPSKILVYSVS